MYIDEEIGTLMAVEHLIKRGISALVLLKKTLVVIMPIATMNDYNMSIDNDHIE